MVRLSKATALAIYGLFALTVGLDDILDYDANFAYVEAVLSMDTVNTNTTLGWRAIESGFVHRVAYALIIGVELLSGALCVGGAVRMLASRRDVAKSNLAKRVGLAGLLLSLLLWFLGFFVIGGEWFLSWQSADANSSTIGLRLTVLVLLLFIFVSSRDEEDEGTERA